MRQSQLFTKTSKALPKNEPSINAQLLIKAGYIDKVMAGVYTYLPLGYIVLEKIKNIIRQEIEAINGQEIYMPALQPKESWQKTERWNTQAMFHLKEKNVGLGWTHEEIITPLAKKFINSYKDLPLAVYQIQDKFRNEPRAKSGLLRGREFSMKDLYSFHANEEDLAKYYEQCKKAYANIFKRCGLKTLLVEATGGEFSKFSHEFQVITKNGEDTIYLCKKCKRHQNKELVKNNKCPYCHSPREIKKAIEVGNIFKLKTKFTKVFNVYYTDQKGISKLVLMGCYGIGTSRLMGTIVEVHHDKQGIIWPKEVSPFKAHLINLNKKSVQADKVYASLQKKGIEVLYDDRKVPAGIKLKDADLMGLPVRLLISEKTKNKIEYKLRTQTKTQVINLEEVINKLKWLF